MPMTKIEIGDLEDLLAHKGWLWLFEQYEAAFGPAVMLEKVTKIAKDTPELHLKTAMIDALLSQRVAVAELLDRPRREISKQREALAQRPSEHAAMRRTGVGL